MAEDLTFQSRGGGYGGGGGGYGGGGDSYGGGSSYGTSEYVDPYVVLASLGFGVFLFNLLYNILNRTGRSVDVQDINIPLDLSDRPEIYSRLEDALLTPNNRWDGDMDQSSSESEGNRLTQLVKHSWLLADSIRQSPAACSKTLLCQIQLGDEKIAWFRRSNSNAHHAVQLYVVWLAHHYGVTENLARFVDDLEADPKQTLKNNNRTECGVLPDECRNQSLMLLL